MMMKSVFWWRKPEYPEETTDLRQVTDETFHTYGLSSGSSSGTGNGTGNGTGSGTGIGITCIGCRLLVYL